VRPLEKNNKTQKGWGYVAQVIDLLSKHETLSTNPSTTKKQKKEKKFMKGGDDSDSLFNQESNFWH
jgi:serine protease inhibitor ecotin